jgi:hypothetical protein
MNCGERAPDDALNGGVGPRVAPSPPGPLASAGARAARLAAAAGAVAALLALGAPGCPVAFFLRVPCPGCGLTRASLRLLRGDLAGALAFHPLVPVVLPLALAFAGTNAFYYVTRGRWGFVDGLTGRAFTAAAAALVALMVGVWVARFFGAFGGPVPV